MDGSGGSGEVIVGQIGYGYWGPNLARTMAGLDGARLATLADLDPGRREQAASALPGTTVVADAGDVLDDDRIEAVVIATPPPTHAPLALRALRAGKAVLVEKPLALTLADGVEVAEASRASGRPVMVGHLLLFHPAVVALYRAVADGALGDIRMIECERTNLGQVRTDLNAWWSLAPHDVSVVLRLTGEDPVEVSSTGSAFLCDGIEDEVRTTIRFGSGKVANIHASWLSPLRRRRISVVGSTAMAVFDDDEPVEKLRILDRGVDTGSDPAGPAVLRDRGATVVEVGDGEPLRAECRAFVDLVLHSTPNPAGVDEALAVLRVLEAGQRSLRTGAAVSLTGS
jgi:predicted dehydrogenase